MTTLRTIRAGLAAATIIAAAAAAAADLTPCAALVNGGPLDPGSALVTDDGALLLTADALEHGLGLTVAPPEEGGPWTVRGFGVEVLTRPEASAYAVEGELRHAAHPCVTVGERIAVPVEMLGEAFGLDAHRHADDGEVIWVLTTPGTAPTDVRHGSHPGKVRLVLDLDRPAGFSWWAQPGCLTIELPAPRDEGGWARGVRLLRFDDPLVSDLRQGPTASNTIRVEIRHGSELPPAVFSLGDPPRIVVDLFRRPEDIPPEPQPTPVAPLPMAAGILETRNFCTPRGNVRVYVLNVDPRSQAIDVRPALAAPTIHRRATVTRMVTGCGAWGGINGGFFSMQGPPLGMLVIDGEWIREPRGGRTVLGITRDGRLLMDRLDFRGRVVFGGLGTQALRALNRGHDEQDTMVMYTRRWGDVVSGARGRTRLAVDASGVVTRKETDGVALAIPQGGFVLSGIGRMAASLDMVEVGTTATVELGTEPAWPDLRHAIGGGPRLVKDGRPHITAAPERFRPDVYAGAASRTAVGITGDGRLLLVAVEAVGGDGERDGMTLQELAGTMIKLGAWQAMNLDGGGSTTFVAGGRMLNTPDDGAARRVSNALLVFTRQVAAADGG